MKASRGRTGPGVPVRMSATLALAALAVFTVFFFLIVTLVGREEAAHLPSTQARLQMAGPFEILAAAGAGVLSLTRTAATWLAIGAGTCLAAIALLSFLLSRRHLGAQLSWITRRAESAAAGDLSAGAGPGGGASEELARAAAGLDGLVGSVRELVGTLTGKLESLRDAAGELSTNMEMTAAAINQINASIEATRPQMEEQSRAVEMTAQTAERVSLTVEGLGAMIEGQTQAVTESSKAIEEMVASIRTVSENTETARTVTGELAGVSADGRTRLASVIKAIDGISRQSADLMAAAKIIASVAANTNLLAMNASIEAAHAGEWGKGFAVVADEIRQLAEKATRQSREISKKLGAVKTGIEGAAKASKETGMAFGLVFDKVEMVGEIIQQIGASMAEQNEHSRLVLEGLGNINDVTVQVREGSIQMKEGSGQILATVARLTQVNGVVRDIITQISSGTAEINIAVAGILSLVQTHTRLIEEASTAAARFTAAE